MYVSRYISLPHKSTMYDADPPRLYFGGSDRGRGLEVNARRAVMSHKVIVYDHPVIWAETLVRFTTCITMTTRTSDATMFAQSYPLS